MNSRNALTCHAVHFVSVQFSSSPFPVRVSQQFSFWLVTAISAPLVYFDGHVFPVEKWLWATMTSSMSPSKIRRDITSRSRENKTGKRITTGRAQCACARTSSIFYVFVMTSLTLFASATNRGRLVQESSCRLTLDGQLINLEPLQRTDGSPR